jgi:hypothetical protein
LVLKLYNLIIGDFMFNQNKITKILGATFILVSSNSVLAETVNSTASVTVTNAFTLEETTPLSFGSVRAIAQADGANVATLVLATDGTTTTTAEGTAIITSLSAATAGVFTVSLAAPFTDLTVTFPPDFEMTSSSAPSTSPVFDVAVGDWVGLVTGGADDGTEIVTAETMQTDSLGGVVLSVGTTLSTDNAITTTAYVDTDYTATYTITVDY